MQSDVATISPAGASSLPSDTLPADEYNRGTGLVTMHNSLMPFADFEDSHSRFTCLTPTGVIIAAKASPVTPAALAEGVEVLRFLLDFDIMKSIKLARDPRAVDNIDDDPFNALIFTAAWRAMQTTLKYLRPRPSVEQLTKAALAIFEQTACPLQLPLSAADGEFELALSGQFLRWETIGLCCVRIGLFCASASTAELLACGHGNSAPDRHTNMQQALDACTQTRTFCDRLEQMNDLTLWLVLSAGLLATWVCGDSSSRSWNLMSDMCSTLIALGFHKDIRGGASVPPYLEELRKRLVAMAHEVDKQQATFTGRPPRLNRKYCVIELPLDLPDAVIMGPVEQFEAAKAELREDGWNQDMKLYPASRSRASLLISMIREQVLELSLGPQTPKIALKAR
jgi:hypothetical protein